MGDKLDYLKSGFKKGSEIGNNEELSITDKFSEYGALVKGEMGKTKDLSQARKERKIAVAQRLKELRKDSSQTQKTIAEATGINEMTLAGYEGGRAEPHFEAIIRLADFYKVSLDYILCRTDTKVMFDKDEYTARDAERTEMNEKIKQLENQISEIKNAIK